MSACRSSTNSIEISPFSWNYTYLNIFGEESSSRNIQPCFDMFFSDLFFFFLLFNIRLNGLSNITFYATLKYFRFTLCAKMFFKSNGFVNDIIKGAFKHEILSPVFFADLYEVHVVGKKFTN